MLNSCRSYKGKDLLGSTMAINGVKIMQSNLGASLSVDYRAAN